MLFYICFGRILHILLSVSSCETYRYEFYMHDKPQTAYTSGVSSEAFFSPSFHGRGWGGGAGVLAGELQFSVCTSKESLA